VMDDMLGQAIPVLGGQCFIRPVDYMGNDAAIVQAARVSFGKGTKKLREDRGLIRYLMRKHHTTPFEMCELKIHALYPMDVWRQWIRHRTASVNEYSTRASEALSNLLTPANGWRLQDPSNKMGSAGLLPVEKGKIASEQEAELISYAQSVYQERLEAGIAREQARKDLPLSTFSMAYWKIDLHNLLHFLHLRLDSHAQQEIREFAQAIAQIVKAWVPLTWEAFTDYRLEAMPMSRLDIEMTKALLDFRFASTSGIYTQPYTDSLHRVRVLGVKFGWFDETPGNSFPRSREREEFEVKYQRLTGMLPWEVSI